MFTAYAYQFLIIRRTWLCHVNCGVRLHCAVNDLSRAAAVLFHHLAVNIALPHAVLLFDWHVSAAEACLNVLYIALPEAVLTCTQTVHAGDHMMHHALVHSVIPPSFLPSFFLSFVLPFFLSFFLPFFPFFTYMLDRLSRPS